MFGVPIRREICGNDPWQNRLRYCCCVFKGKSYLLKVNTSKSEIPRSNLRCIINLAGVIENFNINTEMNYNRVKTRERINFLVYRPLRCTNFPFGILLKSEISLCNFLNSTLLLCD